VNLVGESFYAAWELGEIGIDVLRDWIALVFVLIGPTIIKIDVFISNILQEYNDTWSAQGVLLVCLSRMEDDTAKAYLESILYKQLSLSHEHLLIYVASERIPCIEAQSRESSKSTFPHPSVACGDETQ
jgi:hypothetical protein